MNESIAPLSAPSSADPLAQFGEKQATVHAALARLHALAGELGAHSLAERVERDLLRKLAEDRFNLVVVGEFNSGKSSFVNALLGRAALAAGVTPTTATLHELHYAREPEAAVVLSDGRREPLPFDEVRGFAVGGGRDLSQVDHLALGYPAPLLAQRIVLVDTPGVNDLSRQRADITYGYIPRADAVLFLFDAGQILKESERVFLQEKLLKASRDKIVFVITKWDLLSDEERDEAFRYAQTQLASLVPQPVLFAVSADDELEGREGSGFAELLAHLTTFLAQERGRIQLDNALGAGQAVLSLLDKGIEAKRRAWHMGQDEIERRIAHLERDLQGQAGTVEERRSQIRESIAALKASAHKDLERFTDALLERLPQVIADAKKEELATHLPAYLEHAQRTWAEAEVAELTTELQALAERTIALLKQDADAAAARISEALGDGDKQLPIRVDTFHYDVGVAALFAIGFATLFFNTLLGGLLTVAAPVVALLVKDRVDAKYREQALQQAPKVVEASAAQLRQKLDELLDEFAKNLDAWVVNAGEELHREVLEVLQATRTAKQDGLGDAHAARAQLDAAHTQLLDAAAQIERLRAGLWQAEATRHDAIKGIVTSEASPLA